MFIWADNNVTRFWILNTIIMKGLVNRAINVTFIRD